MSVDVATLSLVFWYGVLHAFGPDHLSAIADFSIGKEAKKTFLGVSAFALGHGMILFLLAKILEHYSIPESLLAYGDVIAAGVIISMGIYLLVLVYANKIHLRHHLHEGKEHLHIWFGDEHRHEYTGTSALSMGILMGIGGVRGMLVTLGVLHGQSVDMMMVCAFVLGVMCLFFTFGVVILWINKAVLTNIKNVRRVFATAGIISIFVGGNILTA